MEDLITPVQAKRPNVEGSTFDRMRASLRTSRVVRFISATGLQIMVSTSTCSFESGSWQRRAEENGIDVSSVVRMVAGLKMLPSMGMEVEVDSLAASRTPFAAVMNLVCCGFFAS